MSRWLLSRRQFARLMGTSVGAALFYIPSQGNFVMIALNGEAQPVIDAFLQRKILVGRQFPSMKNWLRVSIGKPEEMKAFLAGLRAIAPVVSGSGRRAQSEE